MNALISPTEQARQVRTGCGWALRPEMRVYYVTGQDAASYIQTQTTNDVVALVPGHGHYNALVDRKARLKAFFSLHRMAADQLCILVEDTQAETLYDHLEQFHFVEDVTLTPQPGWSVVQIEGPRSAALLTALFKHPLPPLLPLGIATTFWGLVEVQIVARSESGEPGYWVILPHAKTNAFLTALGNAGADLGGIAMSDTVREQLRIEAGWPRYGLDMTADTQLPETGLEQVAVSYSKGCYLGQEVIARIKTYGVIPKALIGLLFDGEVSPAPGTDIAIAGKSVGTVCSGTFSPMLNRPVALAYLRKQHRNPGEVLTFEAHGQSWQATVTRLPFYTAATPQERAQHLYDEALERFAGPEEAHAIPLLEEAIALDPQLADAYEVLGVILSRLGRIDEAIAVMQQLTEIAPEAPMAHTNLSRFFMLQGDKATAEHHMAEATRLDMLRHSKAVDEAQQAAAKAAQQAQMAEMFKEVIETEDPDDLVANYGLGKIYADQGQYADALPYLRKAVTIDRFYSAAWLQLGKTLEQTQALDEARETYRQGITAATQKGDLMPLKEMEQRLMGLGS